MTLHILTCECGRSVPVGAGQAGSEMPCPGCGKRLQIPKLRDLQALPLSPHAGPMRRSPRWGVPEAVLVAGIATSVVCLAVGSWLAQPASTGVDAATIREAISHAPPSDLYKAVKSYEQTGIDRGATSDEARVLRLSRKRAALAAGLTLVAGVAAVAAIGASLAMMLGRRTQSP